MPDHAPTEGTTEIEQPKRGPGRPPKKVTQALDLDGVGQPKELPQPSATMPVEINAFTRIRPDGRGCGGTFSTLRIQLIDTRRELAIGEEAASRYVEVPLNIQKNAYPRMPWERVSSKAQECQYDVEQERDEVLTAQCDPQGKPYGYGRYDPLSGHDVPGLGRIGNDSPTAGMSGRRAIA